jgi:hypothetical protein
VVRGARGTDPSGAARTRSRDQEEAADFGAGEAPDDAAVEEPSDDDEPDDDEPDDDEPDDDEPDDDEPDDEPAEDADEAVELAGSTLFEVERESVR